MAEAIIKYSDLIYDDGGFLKLEKDLESLGKKLEVKGAEIKNHLRIVDVRDTNEIKRLETEVAKLQKGYDALKNAKARVQQEQKKSTQLSKDERIALEKEREAVRQNNNEAKHIAKIKASQVGSIEQLKAKLALVAISWSKLSREERNNSERGERLIASKKALTEELKKEEMATGSAGRNVGNYKESVKEAIREMNAERDALKKVHSELKVEQGLLTKNTAEYKMYSKEIDKTEKEIKQLDLSLGEGEQTMNKFGTSANSARSLIASLGLAFGAFSLIKGAGNLIVEFDQSIANLGALTGSTGRELDVLKQKVLEVSNQTGKSASEISEAMQKIGGAQPELLKNADGLAEVTKQAVLLAQAGNIDVPEAADALTKSMNQFGVSADKAGEFTDILATSQQKGTATIAQLAESMKVSGGTVKAFGGNFQQANALLQGFAKGGTVGSEAGTQLAGALSKLAKVQNKDFNPQFTDSVQVIQNLKDANLSYTDLIKLTDAEGAKWLTTLINQNDTIQSLNGNLYEQGATLKQANQVTDTVAGQYERMVTALQNQILGTEGATTASNTLKDVLKFVGENIGTIISVVTKATIAFITFKAVTKALAFVDLIKMNGGLKESAKQMVGLKKNTEDAGKATTGFGNALKGAGITLAIGLVIELGLAFLKVVSGTSDAENALISYNNTRKKIALELDAESSVLKKRLLEDRKKADEDIMLLERERKTRIKNGESAKKVNKEIDDSILKIQQTLLKKVKGGDDFLGTKIEQNRRQIENYRSQINGLKSDIELLKELEKKEGGSRFAGITADKNKIIVLEENIKALIEENEFRLKLIETTKEGSGATNESSSATANSTKETKANTTELSKNNDELQRRLDISKSLAQIEFETKQVKNTSRLNDLQVEIDREIELRSKQAEEFGNTDLSRLNALLQEQAKLKRTALHDEFVFAMNEKKREFSDSTLIKIQALDDEKATLLKHDNITSAERIKIEESYNQRISELNVSLTEEEKVLLGDLNLLTEQYSNKNKELEQERFDNKVSVDNQILDQQKVFLKTLADTEQLSIDEQIAVLDDSIGRQREIIEKKNNLFKTIELKALKQLEEEKFKLREIAIKDQYDYELAQLTLGSAEYKKVEQEKTNALNNLYREHAKEVKSIDKEIADSHKQTWKDIADTIRDVLNKILDKIEQNRQKEVESNQKKLDEQNKAVDIQRSRAEQGLTNTLAFEQKEQAKKEAELIKAQKRLERIQKVKALYSAYQGYASSGDKNAIAKTLKDFAILEAISATFGDGGIVNDKLPSDGIFRGASHKSKSGGIPIMVEGQEGIFSVKEMANLGKDNFYKIKDLAGRGSVNDIFGESHKQFTAVVPVNSGLNELRQEFRMMRESFENTESQKIDILGWVNGMFQMVETLERKGKKTVNNYKIEKPQF